MTSWFPGHMHKALKGMHNNIKAVDMVLEVRDARVPFTSENAVLNELLSTKKRLLVFNKSDMIPAPMQQVAQCRVVFVGHSACRVVFCLGCSCLSLDSNLFQVPLSSGSCIEEVIDALEAQGLTCMLYMHPRAKVSAQGLSHVSNLFLQFARLGCLFQHPSS